MLTPERIRTTIVGSRILRREPSASTEPGSQSRRLYLPRSATMGELEAAYRQFLRGRPDDLVQLFADDVAYHLPGLHLGGGTLRGRHSVLERLMWAAETCSAPPQVELLRAISAGNLVVTLERFHAEVGGRSSTSVSASSGASLPGTAPKFGRTLKTRTPAISSGVERPLSKHVGAWPQRRSSRTW